MLIGIDASRAVTSQRTGTEAYAYFLIQALLPLAVGRRHQIRLYFNRPPLENITTMAGIEQVMIPFPRLWTHIRLAWELQRRSPDIFFTPAHVIPFTFGGPSVATVHDLGYHHFPEAHPKSQLTYLRWSTRHNSRRSYRIVADSQTTKDDLIWFEGIDPAKIDVIYPGIDPDLRPVTDKARLKAVQQKYGITSPYLLTIGTLQPRKNLVRLIQAYAISNLPHQLVLAGKKGWLAQPILNEIQLHSSPILTLGFIDDDDKATLISGATALVFPSLYEGFGFPALEAQACGTPLLCADSSSLPEIVGDGAVLVDPKDTAALSTGIVQIATDNGLRQKLVKKGFANVKQFTWERTAAQVLETLEKATV